MPYCVYHMQGKGKDEGEKVPRTDSDDMHRIGGSSVDNLRLKPREAPLNPPGISIIMSSQRVTIIDQSRQVVATAKVSEKDGYFAGRIDLSPMPETRRHQFEEYEEMVNHQMFSLLDEIEEKIGALLLKVVFADGNAVQLTDVQIYPSTKKISFKVVKEAVHHTGRTEHEE